MNPQSWKDAFVAGPGPRSKKEYFILFIKAFVMGIADLIPGVSGGTVAFITGIYEELLDAIGSVNKRFFVTLLKGDLKSALGVVHIRFLIPLLMGILGAIFLLARFMHYLMNHHTVLTWSAFFGLIAASIVVVFKEQSDPKKSSNLVSLILGAVFAWIIVGLIPVTTPEESWFVFLCGIISISAMILPGLSGSFLLLILGKYEFITGAVKNPFSQQNFIVLVTFACGSLVGVMGFSRFLNWFLKHYRCQTMAFLTGVLIGSMKKVWPWKEVLETKVIRGKVRILREANIIPEVFDGQVALAIGFILVGFIVVLFIESCKTRRESMAEGSHLV